MKYILTRAFITQKEVAMLAAKSRQVITERMTLIGFNSAQCNFFFFGDQSPYLIFCERPDLEQLKGTSYFRTTERNGVIRPLCCHKPKRKTTPLYA
jgi:hypothetical protein